MRLSEEQRMIRDTVRGFAREELAPMAAEADRTKAFPKHAVRRMGELGLMGMMVAPEWNGAGADTVSLTLAVEELAVADATSAVIMSTQNSLVCGLIDRFGSEAQKERWLKPLAGGTLLGCFCVSEPEAGSDPPSMRSRAILDGDQYRITGTKQFITSGAAADVALVFAKTDPDGGAKGISAFIVPTDTPGFTVARTETKLGIRASGTAQLVFEDMAVPVENRLGAEGDGYRIALAGLGASRIGIAAQAVGIAQAAFDAARDYALERTSFGSPIIEHQAVGFRLADMATEIAAAREITMAAAAARDATLNGGTADFRLLAGQAKLFASEMAERVTSAALQTFGGYGHVEGFPVERYWRDARVCKIYEGTSEIQRMVISRMIAE